MAKVRVHFSSWLDGLKPPLAAKLESMGVEERIQQLQELEELWVHADIDRSDVDKVVARTKLQELLGTDELSRWYGSQTMYSLTPDGKQFRCWIAPFGRVSWHRTRGDSVFLSSDTLADFHVSGCRDGGRDLLYGIVGEADDVKQYVTSLTSGRLRGELRFGGDAVVQIWLGWVHL